jgi:hypothetical protein
MLKKLLATALLACTIPAMASAATSWQLTTQATTAGGSITSRNMTAQTNSAGSVFKSYTTHGSIGYTVNPATGYSVSKITVNGTVYTNGTNAPTTVLGLVGTVATAQSVTAAFSPALQPVTATAGVGGTVSPASVPNIYYGTKLTSPLVFTFTPAAGFSVAGISGNGAGVIAPAVPAAAGTIVRVTYPVGYTFTGSIALSGSFASTLPIANAGAAQTVAPGTVTLNGSYTGTTVPTSYTWSQVSGPSVGTIAAGNPVSVNATTVGAYVFKLTLNGGSTSNTTVYVTNSSAAAARNQCVSCHTTYGVGSGVFNNWSASAHEAATVMCYNCHVGANTGAHPGTVNNAQNNSVCQSCHTGNAAIDALIQVQNWNKSTHSIANNHFEQIYCNACHNQHSLVATVTDDKTDSCASCHVYRDATHNYSIYTSASRLVMSAPHGGGAPVYMGGLKNSDGSLYTGTTTNPTSGYTSKGAEDNAAAGWAAAKTSYMTRGAICTDCHGHNNTINAGFAEGGHGKVSDDTMNAWNHYDWSKQTNNGTRQAGNCDRCHTAYGFMKFANQTTGYARLRAPLFNVGVYNNNQANYQANNVLICVACHSSVEGPLRTNAVVAGTVLTNGYFALFSSNVATLGAGNTKTQVAFPGYKNSSICVPCHSGRTTDKYVRDNIATIANYSTLQLSNYQHAANMGQTFIGKGAWEFTPGKYAGFAANQTPHTTIGMDTNQGPCVGCHYSTLSIPNKANNATHSLEVNLGSATCTPCHGGADIATKDVKFGEFSSARFALDQLVRVKMAPLLASGSSDLNVERGGYFRYGRFGKAPGVAADRLTAQNAYGAVYNWQLVKTWDRAAWAHNPAYARQIVFDTLAFVQTDGADLAGTANNVAAALVAAKAINANVDTAAAAAFVGGNKNPKALCVGCHAVARNAGANFVQDNNGVRAITTEFSKWSHHVTGVTLNDAHCAACHLEGKVVNGAIEIDATKHVADRFIHLRNADTDADFAWNPEAPNHTGMDNFCFSCHDSDASNLNKGGATSAASQAIQALINTVGGAYNTGIAASALNPFGDTISNRYDKMARGAVVDALGQFATGNNSHHAVSGKKYSGSERGNGTDARTINTVTFAQNSSAALPGERETLREAGVLKTFAAGEITAPVNANPANLASYNLNTMYQTLSPAAGTDATLGDDSPLHCADCHTVGQYAAKGTVAYNNAKAAYLAYTTYNRVAIGAHGSNNEYMLRNSRGTDELHVAANYNLTATAASGNAYKFNNPASPFLVCYNCHAFQTYGSVFGVADGPGHIGEYAKGNRCNGENNTFAGYTTGTLVTYGGQANFNAGRLINPSLANGGSGNGGGNIFAIQCANCHNSGPDNKFGGIHGSKTQTYPDANGIAQPARRFLSGLGNWKHVPMGSVDTVANTSSVAPDTGWEMEKARTGEGCYTLSSKTTASVSVASSQNASGQTMFGTWGACADHGGTPAVAGKNYVTGGDAFERKILRPVAY